MLSPSCIKAPFIRVLGVGLLASFLISCIIPKSDEYGVGLDSSGKVSKNSGDFAKIYSSLLAGSCKTCHTQNGAPSVQNLKYHSIEAAYATMVNKTSQLDPTKKIVDPNNPENSVLYLILQGPFAGSDQMPLNNPKASQEMLDLVKKWISKGAILPGSDTLIGIIGDDTMPEVLPKPACKDPNVTPDFVNDTVWAIFKNNCTGCHGSSGAPSIPKLKMGSMQQLLTTATNISSDTTPAYKLLVPGSPEQSLIYLKLLTKPPKGGVMPPGDSLSTTDIGHIRRWITEGAKAPAGTKGPFLGYVSRCDECPNLDSVLTAADSLKLWGNGRCHPCNNSDLTLRPAYCVSQDFFIDFIIPKLQEFNNCLFCHQGAGAAAGLAFNVGRSTALDSSLSQAEKAKRAYEAFVGIKTSVEPNIYPYYRVWPNDTAGSYFLKIISKRRPIFGTGIQKDSLVMSPYSPKRDSVLVDYVRRWILSGAPGPGNINKVNAVKFE